MKDVHGIAAPLTAWYRQHERPFPWRTDSSPYRVWVSEIMLQQTRIEAALPYFERFMESLPTVADLANTSEDVLLKLWEGLGYYSRVRNLQKAAQQVMDDFGGEIPSAYDQLITLAGVGEYTAGAIASIAFGQRVAAVDGNVLRVLARLTKEDGDVMKPAVRKQLSALVNEIVPEECPGDFNQGLMELGETICLPNTMPHCHQCPIREYCAVAGTEYAAQLPTRAAPKQRRTEKRTVLTVLSAEQPPKVLLHRREAKGLLGGMWELPNLLCDPQDEDVMNLIKSWGATVLSKRVAVSGKHVFSHVEWHLKGQIFTVTPFDPPEGYVWVDQKNLHQYALPTAFRLYAEKLPQLLEEDVK